MKDFLEYLVKSIVKKEDAVSVVEEIDDSGTINLKLTVDKDDMGLVIGKEGKIIKAIRNLLKAKAIREEKRVNLELMEIPEIQEPASTPE